MSSASWLTMASDGGDDLGEAQWRSYWPSRFDQEHLIVATLDAVLHAQVIIAPDDAHWLRLCCQEAVINAMAHGNEADPELIICCACWCTPTTWIVRISDQGRGFTPRQVPDPEAADSLLLEHGRGIRIMHEWLDVLRYVDGGRTVHMQRHHGGLRSA